MMLSTLSTLTIFYQADGYEAHGSNNKYNVAPNGWSVELAATSNNQPTLASPTSAQEPDTKNHNSKLSMGDSSGGNDWTRGSEIANGPQKSDGLTVGFLSSDNQSPSSDALSATYADLNSLKAQLAALQQANNLSQQQQQAPRATSIDEYASPTNQQQHNYLDYPLASSQASIVHGSKTPLMNRFSMPSSDTLDRIDQLAVHESGHATSTSPAPSIRTVVSTSAPQIARPLVGANHASIWNPFIHQDEWLPLMTQQALLMSQGRQLPQHARAAINGYLPAMTTKSLPSPWMKAFGSKRRSYDPLAISDSQRAAKVNFDDLNTPDAMRFDHLAEQQHNRATTSKRDYFASLANLPMLFESASAPPAKHFGIKYHEEDSGSLDNLLAASKFSSGISHQTPSPSSYFAYNLPSQASSATATAYYPAYAGIGHHHHKLAAALHPRKGLDKSLGVPIVVGIGAALISFLIISNLFLSIPLFAMTLMQFMNGNSMLLPNNQPQPQPSQLTTPATPNAPLGRKRRAVDFDESDLEHRVKKAISYIF